MKRVLAAVALAGVSGCYGSYVEPTPVYQTTTEYAPYETPPPVTVTVAPPPPRYESAMQCGYGTMWFPGRWEYRSNWYWARGYCSETRPGYVYVAPRYVNGVYYRAHWGQPSVVYGGGGYGGGVRPAPGYGGGSVYVPPPGGVRPAPVYGGGGGNVYVAPSGGVRPAPVYGGGGGNVYVAPSGGVRPAPSAGSVYVPPPGGGGVRPAPSFGGGYSPPPANVVHPAPQPYRGPTTSPQPAPYRGPTSSPQPAPYRGPTSSPQPSRPGMPSGYRPSTPPGR